jgi:hypothetical protein
MTTAYPSGFDTFVNPQSTDQLGSTTVPHDKQHANANDAIVAIENELGINPSGSYSTVAARFAALPGATPLYYGSFYDTTNQTNPSTSAANLISIGNTNVSNGISVQTGSKLTFANSGSYLVNLLAQAVFTGGASSYNITIWYAKNGTIVNNSAFTFTVGSGSQNAQTLLNIEDIFTVNAGDYFQFYWWSPASGMSLTTTSAGTNPTRPVSPSVNLIAFNVG